MSARILLLTASIAVLGSNSLLLSPILADVAAGLGTTPVTVSRALAAYGGATALSAFLLAPTIDRIGARTALLVGLAALAAATLLSAAAPHWSALVAGQGMAGLGAGLALPAIYALATTTGPPEHRSRVLGRVLTGWSISLVAGVPAAAALADLAGWRAPFLVLALLASAALVGTARLLPRESADPIAAAAAEVPRRWTLLAPLAIPTVPTLLAICLVFMAAFYGVYAFLGDHLRATLGLSASRAGLAVLAYGVGFGAASLGDRLVDRHGPRRVFPLALGLVGLVYAAMLPPPPSLAAAMLLTALWGFANHLGLNILLLLLAEARPAARGAVLGLNSAVTYLGALLGVAVAGPVYATVGFTPLAAGSAALMAAAAGLALLGLGPRRVAEPAA